MANPGSSSLIMASKIGLLLLCVLSAGAAARVAVPAAAEALAVAFPGYRAALRSWLAPPYLFVAVHVIIFFIWKLSDQKQLQQQQGREQWAAESRTVDSGKTKKSIFLGSPPVSGLLGKPSQDTWRRPDMPPSSTAAAVLAPDPVESSSSDASCLTTDSDEVHVVSSAVMGKRGSEEDSNSSVKNAEEEDEAAVAAGEIANESMEVTQKAITEEAPSSATPDEFNRRIDDFIKKTHEQIRLLNGRRRS